MRPSTTQSAPPRPGTAESWSSGPPESARQRFARRLRSPNGIDRSDLLARLAPVRSENFRVDRDRKRNVAADADRMQHVGLVAPNPVFIQHAIGAEVRDQHRRTLYLD